MSIDPERVTWPDEYLRTADVAQWLNVNPSTLCEWRRHEGMGPHYVKFGRLARYRRSDVQRWIDEQDTAQEAS